MFLFIVEKKITSVTVIVFLFFISLLYKLIQLIGSQGVSKEFFMQNVLTYCTVGIISGELTNTCMGLGGGTHEQSSTISKTFGAHASFNKHFWDTLLVKQKIWDTLTPLLSILHIRAFTGLGYLNWWYLEFLNTPFLPLIYFSHQSHRSHPTTFCESPLIFGPSSSKSGSIPGWRKGGDSSWQWLGMIIVSFRGQNQGFGIF